MSQSSSPARFASRCLLALGLLSMGTGVARGLWTNRLLEPGSNNLVVFVAGLGLFLCGWAIRHRRLAGLIDRGAATSAERTPEFLATRAAYPIFYLGLGIGFGLAQGLAEVAYRLYHDPTPPWRHSAWLGPIAYAVVFGLVGVAAALIRRRDSTGRAPFRLTLWLLMTMSAAGWVLLALPQMHAPAAILLASGVAVQLSRLLVAQAYAVGAILRPARWVLSGAIVAVMGGALGADALHAYRSRTVALEPPAGARNVVLIVLDTVRARNLSLLGYGRKTTPVLERWSSRAVVFESAMATAPWTLPSHATMFTGRWAHELNAGWAQPLDGRFPTLAEVLRAQGYATAGFVANLSFTTREHGLARGFEHYEDFTISAVESVLSTSLGANLLTRSSIRNALEYHQLANRKTAPGISADFLDWLDRNESRPFFAFLNYFDAHEPYEPPQAFVAQFRRGPPISRGPFLHYRNFAAHADWWSLSPEQVAQEEALYDAAIAWQDHELGRLLDALDRRGVLETTVVIITSDHGEHFGEHGLFNHGNNLYMPQLHVPLWILVPGRTTPERVHESVSLRDLASTVLDLSGLDGASPFPGLPLARYWMPGRHPETAPDTLYGSLLPAPWAQAQPTPSARGPMRSIIEDPYHYILNGDGVEELYEYRTDPDELRNLAGSAAAERLLVRFRELLRDETP
jgi:arylsulfatase A-like enzyme